MAELNRIEFDASRLTLKNESEVSQVELPAATTSAGADSVVASVNISSPNLPVEVLERIINAALSRSSALTPYSDPQPLRGASHLLLVSKGFRQLCLPFFYREIVLAKGRDYLHFFDPEEGIFNVGKEGERLWSFVRDISILVGVYPPLSSLPLSPNYLSPLLIPPCTTLFSSLTWLNPTIPSETSPTGKEITALRNAIAPRGFTVFSYAPNDHDDLSDRLINAMEGLGNQRRVFFTEDLLTKTRPKELRISLDALDRPRGGVPLVPVGEGEYGMLRMWWSEMTRWGEEPSPKNVAEAVKCGWEYFGTKERVVLVGFPEKFKRELKTWIRDDEQGGLELKTWAWEWKGEEGEREVVKKRRV